LADPDLMTLKLTESNRNDFKNSARQNNEEEITSQETGFINIPEKSDCIDDTEVIRLVNVHKTYLLGLEGVPALRGVNLTIKKGEFVTILGTSGGGKTTMLNIIGTIDKPTKVRRLAYL
jgi:putative ABC transport system ATP-binding protein